MFDDEFKNVDPVAAKRFKDNLLLLLLEDEKGRFRRWACDAIDVWTHHATDYCQSPIEQLLFSELPFVGFGYGTQMPAIADLDLPLPRPNSEVLICPQHAIGNYRVDFALIVDMWGDGDIKVVIECDGHDFHEKTKQQATRDKKRDRELQKAGWKVLRYTGSEIFKDVEAIAYEISGFICDLVEEQPTFRLECPNFHKETRA